MRRARGRRAAVAAGLALALAALLSACFTPPPSHDGLADPDALTALPELTDARIVHYCPGVVPRHLDGVVTPTDVVYACRADVRMDTDGVSTYGPWQVAYRIAHPERLLQAYAHPDAVAFPVADCGARIVDPLLIWVDHAGVVSAYYAPVDGCGAPTQKAATAYHQADRVVVADVDTGEPGYEGRS